MLDMIRPANSNRITLQDLKRCKMTPVFFDTFFNLEKYLDHEQRDPFATQREVDEDGNEVRIYYNKSNCLFVRSLSHICIETLLNAFFIYKKW